MQPAMVKFDITAIPFARSIVRCRCTAAMSWSMCPADRKAMRECHRVLKAEWLGAYSWCRCSAAQPVEDPSIAGSQGARTSLWPVGSRAKIWSGLRRPIDGAPGSPSCAIPPTKLPGRETGRRDPVIGRAALSCIAGAALSVGAVDIQVPRLGNLSSRLRGWPAVCEAVVA